MSCNDGLLVIGAGLPRTGTTSMKFALERLLGGTCYHMFNVFHSKGNEDVAFWNKALSEQSVSDEVIKS